MALARTLIDWDAARFESTIRDLVAPLTVSTA
jgi:hypothetical protein